MKPNISRKKGRKSVAADRKLKNEKRLRSGVKAGVVSDPVVIIIPD